MLCKAAALGRPPWKSRTVAGQLCATCYYPETDSLYIDLNSKPSADSREIAEGPVIDFDAEGNVVGIDIDHASQKLDLKTLEAIALPPVTTKAP